jgi:exodeoxyribonuclease VII large subunit
MLSGMEQLSLFQAAHWSVSELTRYLRQLLESNETLQDVWVQGEVSNASRPASGHLYFTLKDSAAALRCVMWRSDATRNRIVLQDGTAVEAHGKIGIYDAGGQYQLYVDLLRPVGEGALFQEFLRLKSLLESEGLFAPDRKRPIPDLPRRIGIVTSPTGAALRDMLDTLRRRFPLAEVILAPSQVQGNEAPPALVSALRALNTSIKPDVILIARGGGSIEDLWAFNDEGVVRAVAASRTPVISGVGHETDFTLVDFAADLRAPTPTAAAELATPITIDDLASAVNTDAERMAAAFGRILVDRRTALGSFETRLRLFSPARRIQSERQRLDELAHRGDVALAHRLELSTTRLTGLAQRLESLSPLAVLSRGYAVVTRQKDGRLVHSTKQVRAGDALNVRVADGSFGVRLPEKP